MEEENKRNVVMRNLIGVMEKDRVKEEMEANIAATEEQRQVQF